MTTSIPRRAGTLLVYGAYGYTGQLAVRRAVARGLRPVIAGRRAAALAPLARELDLEARAFALDDAAAVARGLAGCSAVLHCAGPFSRTWRPVAEACLRAGTHYVDVTGETAVFEALAALDGHAASAGVMLLPGAGFDVVPTSCLAAHLKRLLPGATSLALTLRGFGRISRGTARTVLEALASGDAVARGPLATRTFDVGSGPFTAVSIPSADVFAARRTTGMADISLYYPAALGTRVALRALPWLSPLTPALRNAWVRDAVVRSMTGGAPGPDDAQRAGASVTVQGEARDGRGETVRSRLRLPDGYTFTASAAIEICERILAGDAPPGFQTPATAYGPDLVCAIDGVRREDLSPA